MEKDKMSKEKGYLEKQGYNLRERFNIYGGMFVSATIPPLLLYLRLGDAVEPNCLTGEILKPVIFGGFSFLLNLPFLIPELIGGYSVGKMTANKLRDQREKIELENIV